MLALCESHYPNERTNEREWSLVEIFGYEKSIKNTNVKQKSYPENFRYFFFEFLVKIY